MRYLLALAAVTTVTLSSCGKEPEKTAATPTPTATASEAAANLTAVDLADSFPSKLLIERLQQGLGAASGPVPRPLSTPTLLLIKDFEGWSALKYDDPVGYCTIGWGHLIALQRCHSLSPSQLGDFVNPISPAEGEKLLEMDTRAARTAVLRLVKVHLDDNEFGALSTFVFNLGEGNFAGSTLRTLVNRKENNGAAKQFLRWTMAKRKVQPGLVIRRKCEATLYLGQLRLDAKGHFSRANCGALGAVSSGAAPIDIEIGEPK